MNDQNVWCLLILAPLTDISNDIVNVHFALFTFVYRTYVKLFIYQPRKFKKESVKSTVAKS